MPTTHRPKRLSLRRRIFTLLHDHILILRRHDNPLCLFALTTLTYCCGRKWEFNRHSHLTHARAIALITPSEAYTLPTTNSQHARHCPNRVWYADMSAWLGWVSKMCILYGISSSSSASSTVFYSVFVVKVFGFLVFLFDQALLILSICFLTNTNEAASVAMAYTFECPSPDIAHTHTARHTQLFGGSYICRQ